MDAFQRATLVVFTLLSCTYYAQATGCCALFSYQIEAVQLQSEYGAALNRTSFNRLVIAYDLQPGQLKAFVNATIRTIKGETMSGSAIYDYNDNKLYFFTDKSCTSSSLLIGPKLDACIPDNARSLGTFSLGGSLNFTAYSLKETGTTDSYNWAVSADTLVESNTCIPTFSSGLFVGYNTTVGLSSEQLEASVTFEYHASRVKSFSVFTPPPICHQAETREKESKPSFLAEMLLGMETFNVFKVLNRLTAAAEILKNK